MILNLSSTIFLIIACAAQCLAVDYFINPSGGNDKARGTSAETAWQTANPLQKTDINPGDRILIHAGDTLRQSLIFENVQGSSNAPFTISRYGEGNDPLIIGKNSEHAIYFLNPAFVVIEQLQIQNPNGKNGIFMEGKNAGELKDITLQSLEITAVYDASREITEPSKIRGGIVFEITKGDESSWFNGVNILNNHIHDLGSCGITVGSDYKVVKDYDGGDERYPNLGVLIANNKIHDIVRDGAIIRQCKGGVMEHNEVWRTGLVAISNGMWWYDSDSCVIQYNVGHHCKAAFDKDGAPFSIDNSSTRCVIQYNYSYDNEGPGYMLFGHDDNGFDNVIRHNLSVNDHTNNMSTGTGSIAIVSRVTKARVENNTIIAGPGTRMMLGHRDWDGYPLDVTYTGNMFIGNLRATISEHVLPAGKFEKNFFTKVPDLPEELKAQTLPENYQWRQNAAMERLPDRK